MKCTVDSLTLIPLLMQETTAFGDRVKMSYCLQAPVCECVQLLAFYFSAGAGGDQTRVNRKENIRLSVLSEQILMFCHRQVWATVSNTSATLLMYMTYYTMSVFCLQLPAQPTHRPKV